MLRGNLPEADIERKCYKDLRESKVASYDTSCTICFEDYTAESEIVLIKNCKHFFHYECLNQWFKNKKTCPLDRKPITAINIRRFRLRNDSFGDIRSEPSLSDHDDGPNIHEIMRQILDQY